MRRPRKGLARPLKRLMIAHAGNLLESIAFREILGDYEGFVVFYIKINN